MKQDMERCINYSRAKHIGVTKMQRIHKSTNIKVRLDVTNLQLTIQTKQSTSKTTRTRIELEHSYTKPTIAKNMPRRKNKKKSSKQQPAATVTTNSSISSEVISVGNERNEELPNSLSFTAVLMADRIKFSHDHDRSEVKRIDTILERLEKIEKKNQFQLEEIEKKNQLVLNLAQIIKAKHKGNDDDLANALKILIE